MPATMPPVPTMADVAAILAGLGGVPPERIWMTPMPGTATEADVIRVVESLDNRLVELVDGTLVEKAMGQRESRVTGELIYQLIGYTKQHDIGWVSIPDGMTRMSGGNVRLPDAAFYPFSMYPNDTAPNEKIASLSPALAVEVLSESNTVAEIAKMLREYFASGTKLAWVIDPEKCVARIHTAATTFTTLDETGSLDGAGVMPGFRCALGRLFIAGDHLSPTRKKAP